MKVTESEIPGVLFIEPVIYQDARGLTLESHQSGRYGTAGLPSFVQDNVSLSKRGVLRGLHYQHPNAQAKLVTALEGEIFDVAVDIRVGSPWFGKWVGKAMSGEKKEQIFIPAGFAHGFCVLSEKALVSYKCSELYHPNSERGIRWDDPTVGIAWPLSDPLLSPKDAAYGVLESVAKDSLPIY